MNKTAAGIVGQAVIFAALIPGAAAPQSAAKGSNPAAAGKVRVLITESNSWSTDSGPPTTDEVLNTFSQKCPAYRVTIDYRQETDYIVRLDRKGAAPKLTLLTKAGGAVYSGEKAPLADAMKRVCSAIQRDIQDAKEKKNKKVEPPRPPNLGDHWPGSAQPKKQ